VQCTSLVADGWKYLAEMTYEDFHRETGSELGKQNRRRVRV